MNTSLVRDNACIPEAQAGVGSLCLLHTLNQVVDISLALSRLDIKIHSHQVGRHVAV